MRFNTPRCWLCGRAKSEASEPSGEDEQAGGKPNSEELALDDGEAAVAEESRKADGGNTDWTPGEEVASVVEGGKQGHTKAAVGHSVEEPVAGSHEEEVEPKAKRTEAWNTLPKHEKRADTCQKRSENEGMRKSAMSPEIGVMDAELESNHIQIGNHRASHPD